MKHTEKPCAGGLDDITSERLKREWEALFARQSHLEASGRVLRDQLRQLQHAGVTLPPDVVCDLAESAASDALRDANGDAGQALRNICEAYPNRQDAMAVIASDPELTEALLAIVRQNPHLVALCQHEGIELPPEPADSDEEG